MAAGPLGRVSVRRTATRSALRENELRAALLMGDTVAAGLAALAAPLLWVLFDREFTPRVDLRLVEVVFVVAWVILLRVLGGGDLASPRFGRRALAAVGRAAVAAAVLVLAMFFITPFFAPRGSTLLTLPLLAGATLVWRYAYLRGLRSRILERRVAVVGTDEGSLRAASALAAWQGAMRYETVAFLTAAEGEQKTVLGAPVVQAGTEPWRTIDGLGVDLLVVGHTRSVPPELLAELTRCFEHGVEAVPATMLYEQLTGRVLASSLEADWYAELPTYTRGSYLLMKRLIDVAFAVLAGMFALMLAPFIAVAIALESGSPIVLRQVRVGLRGDQFVMHKFRTMHPDAEGDGLPRWTMLEDDRITRVGSFLRRTRLDELPQLWDVLAGTMSLIGPRPERPEFVEQLSRELPVYRARSLVRPGITGWAQVMYPYAGTIGENLAKLEYDLYYIRHFGLLLDLSILLRTVTIVLGVSKPEFAETSTPGAH